MVPKLVIFLEGKIRIPAKNTNFRLESGDYLRFETPGMEVMEILESVIFKRLKTISSRAMYLEKRQRKSIILKLNRVLPFTH
jgi:hypothetical protein